MNSKEKSEIGLVALDAEATPIVQGKLHSNGCDLVVYPVGDGVTRLVIKVKSGEIRMRSRLAFLPTLQLINSEMET